MSCEGRDAGNSGCTEVGWSMIQGMIKYDGWGKSSSYNGTDTEASMETEDVGPETFGERVTDKVVVFGKLCFNGRV